MVEREDTMGTKALPSQGAVLTAIVLLLPLHPRAGIAQPTGPERLTLAGALERAQQHYEGFAQAEEEFHQVELARERAWSALLPSLVGRATYTHSDREISFNDRILRRQDSLAGNVSATLTFRSNAVGALVTTGHQVAAAGATRRWTENELAFHVAEAFFAALAGGNLVRAAERTLATAGEHEVAAAARQSVGEVLPLDERRARLEVVRAREDLLRAQNAHANAVDYLAFLLGSAGPLPPLESPPTAPEGIDTDDTDAPRGPARQDVVAAEHQLQAARGARLEAWLDYLPTLSLAGNLAGTQNTGWSGRPLTWEVVLTLDWVLFDGGQRRVTRRQRASEIRQTELQLQQLGRVARQEFRQARRDLETALAALQTSQEGYELAQQNRHDVLERYRAGLAMSLDIVEADQTLRQSELDLVARDLELTLSRLALLRALGRDPLGRNVTP
jgi:outer membrane protein TolC